VAGPLELLEALARQEVVITPTFRHLEVFTMRGLLTVLWHGDPDAEAAVILGVAEPTVAWRMHEVRRILSKSEDRDA